MPNRVGQMLRGGVALAVLGAAALGCPPAAAPAEPSATNPGSGGTSAGGSGGSAAGGTSSTGGVSGSGGGPADTGGTPIDTAAPGTGGAGGAPVDSGPPSGPEAAAPSSVPAGPFGCTLVLGIKQTGEWFTAGFETVVDSARWEVVPVHNGHVELWADANNGIWGQKPQSPCAQNPANPDRVIFVGTNYDYTTTEEFVPKLSAVVENIKARFAAVKRIELMTHVRAPGNVACPGNLGFKTYIKPAQDQAIGIVVGMYPGLVVASPKFEANACSDYNLYPHFAGASATAIGKKIGEHYKD
jgi:hypothetical protein